MLSLIPRDRRTPANLAPVLEQTVSRKSEMLFVRGTFYSPTSMALALQL
jgi:hypothetical protein